jgi:hypothetical protein
VEGMLHVEMVEETDALMQTRIEESGQYLNSTLRAIGDSRILSHFITTYKHNT